MSMHTGMYLSFSETFIMNESLRTKIVQIDMIVQFNLHLHFSL